MDEASFAEAILQLDQSRQRSRDLLQLTRAAVTERLDKWKLFEQAVNRVLCLVKRLNYARNMASIKSSVDLQRLLAAKQTVEVGVLFSFNFFFLHTTWDLFTMHSLVNPAFHRGGSIGVLRSICCHLPMMNDVVC